jgi:hypothetical protein
MSDHHAVTVPAEERLDQAKATKLSNLLLIVGGISLVLACLYGYFVDAHQFAFSWLWAFMYGFTITIGSLFWVLLHHAVDADWTVVVRRVLENMAVQARVLIFLFIPILCVLPILFQWWNVPPGVDHLLDHKSGFLNHTFFYIRLVIIFGFMVTFSYLMRHFSTSQDKDGDVKYSLISRKFAYGGIPLVAITVTLAGVDWLMALNYHWFSTMWGVYIFAGSIQSAMAVLILISNTLVKKGYLKGVFSEEHNHIMGKLLLAFTIFWAYIGFSQYMLYYYANIPEETIFYAQRNLGGWQWISRGLFVCKFLIPFLLLLSQFTKRNPIRLCFAACWILFFHGVDLYWIIMPYLQVNEIYHAHGHYADLEKFGYHVSFHWVSILALIAVISLIGSFFVRSLSRRNLFPVRDPRLYESVTLKN